MLPLLVSTSSALAYTLMQILFKRGKTYGGSPLALTAWLGLLLPLWLGLYWLGASQNLIILIPSTPYFAATLLWGALATGSLALIITLIQRLSLTELTAYRKAFAATIALLVDVFLLHTSFKLTTLAGIAVILAASIILSLQAPLLPRQRRKRAPLGQSMAAIFLLSATLIGQLYVYRLALSYQPDVLSHIFVAKACMAAFSLSCWAFPSVRKHPQPGSYALMATIALCYFIASLTEGYALQNLPLTLVVITSFVAAACFTLHDLWQRDLPNTPKTWLALAAIFFGFALLAIKL